MGAPELVEQHLAVALPLAAQCGPFVQLDVERAAAEARARVDRRAAPPVATGPTTASLVRDGDVWAITWDATTVRVRHAKGVADLAAMLARPARELHVRDLEAGSIAGASVEAMADADALGQYRARLREIEAQLDDADRDGDIGRSTVLTAERDALVAELARTTGLGGRARRAAADPDERLRKAVSARVKASIERIEQLHPALGRHLRASVRTGFWCSYAPERPVEWRVLVDRSR
jgi:hypothetical protein